MKFKTNDKVLYPIGPNNIPKEGTIVGKGRYENLYIIKTANGDLTSLRADDTYDKWLESITMKRSKKKSQSTNRKHK
jgi:hypothetical protein